MVAVLIAVSGTYLTIYFNSDLKESPQLPTVNPSSNMGVQSKDIKQAVYEIDPHIYEKQTYNDTYAPAIDITQDTYWQKLMQESLNKYGDVVSMYWPDYLVSSVDEFDVDGDGNFEKIVSMLPPGVNGKGSRVDIVKNGKIIFSDSDYYAWIEKGDTNNNFFLHWRSGEQFDRGSVEYKTKFVYGDSKFTPVWEQEIELPQH